MISDDVCTESVGQRTKNDIVRASEEGGKNQEKQSQKSVGRRERERGWRAKI